jgi:hypothetical protein
MASSLAQYSVVSSIEIPDTLPLMSAGGGLLGLVIAFSSQVAVSPPSTIKS